MRIGFFTDGFLPQPNGVAISVFESAKELERRGHEVFIIAPKYPGYIDREANVIRLASVKIYKQPETRVALNLPDKYLRRVLSIDFDIIHGHSGGPVTFLGWEVSRTKKIPFVLTYHTLWNRYTHYFFKGKIVKPRLMEKATKIFGNRVDYLIAPTSRVEQELRSYGVKKPIAVIPSGIDIDRFQEKGKGLLRKKLGLKDKPILLFVGRLGREKSIDFIIKSFNEVCKKESRAHLVILGEGPERKRLESLGKRLGIAKNIHFISHISNEEIHRAYQDATVFVFSSTTETQGLVVLEALSSGVPVVAIDDPAYECIESGKNGFLVKKDKNEFALKILSIIENKDLRAELSKNALETAQRFSVKSMVDSLERVYSELLDKYNKESVARIMRENEHNEQTFVVHLSFFSSIIAVRILTFLFYKAQDPYPSIVLGDQIFYHSTAGLLMIFLGIALLLRKRAIGLLSLLSFGFGIGFVADELWSVLGAHEAVSDYWNFLNLIPILTLGVLPLIFARSRTKGRPKFYITTRQQFHVNPESPKISVVVPAYNEAEFIAITLKSLINQTYNNFELIVVDNNSEDDTSDVAKKYGARVVFEKKKGVAAARQAGFFAAKGQIIATTDADSVVPENWVETIVGAYGKDENMVAFGGLNTLYSGPVTARAAGRYLFPAFWVIDKILSGGWNMCGFNMSVRKGAFFEIGGFRSDLTMGEDIDLVQRLRKVGKVKVDTGFCVFSSGRRYRYGLLAGLGNYAPSYFMRVLFKKEKFLTFNPVRSEKVASSKFTYLPLALIISFIIFIFYLANSFAQKFNLF